MKEAAAPPRFGASNFLTKTTPRESDWTCTKMPQTSPSDRSMRAGSIFEGPDAQRTPEGA